MHASIMCLVTCVCLYMRVSVYVFQCFGKRIVGVIVFFLHLNFVFLISCCVLNGINMTFSGWLL